MMLFDFATNVVSDLFPGQIAVKAPE